VNALNVAGLARAPSFLGPYRLIGTLGEGGMGVVHLALDPGGRAVAVKVLRPQVAGDGVGRRRLGREVASLRRVRHPNVAEVLDADLDGPAPYMVTAFVPARTLEHHVRRHGPLPAPYVAHLGRVMISALRAIHAAGVVHRDVKPANVLLLDDAPVLIDFGIAHVVDESRITMSGLIMGTPGYLPPELVEGQSITPATDWWAWGATLAYAATGRAPFGSGPAAVVLDRVRRGEADLDGVDPRIARVLAMALNVNPLWRGTGDMLLAGLASIEPWRPGARPFAPALTPDQVRTIPLVTSLPAAAPPAGLRPTAPMPAELVPTDVVSAPAALRGPVRQTPPPPPPARTAVAPAPSAPTVRAPSGPPVPAPSGPPVPAGPIRPRPVGSTLALALATLAALATVVPGLAIVLSLAWAVVARVADRTITGTMRRRYSYGPRSGDLGVALAALPWRTLTAIPQALLGSLLPGALAVSAAFLAGAVISPGAPQPDAAPALAIATVVGGLAAWWGPGGMALRRGTRGMALGLARRRRLHVGVLVLLGFVLVAAVRVAGGGASPDWGALGTARDAVPSLPSLPSFDPTLPSFGPLR
jgi:serine/threonine protein kinase